MTQAPAPTTRTAHPRRHRTALALCTAMVLAAGGCHNSDSFMDPSVVGRWERTPTKVPILTHLDAIEDEDVQFVEITNITPADLLPEAEAYRLGAGDFIQLQIWDLEVRGQPWQGQRGVDQNGYIEVPQLGRIFVNGLTETQVAEEIGVRMADIVQDPSVSVVVLERRAQLFHLMGAVSAPGPYRIPAADYKLLQALVSSGGFPEYVEDVLVIRQVPLTPEAAGRMPEDAGDYGSPRGPMEAGDHRRPDPSTDDLVDLIDDLAEPSVAGGGGGYDMLPSFDVITRAERRERAERLTRRQPEPIVDLIPEADTGEPNDIRDVGEPGSDAQGPRWIFRDGQWVRVAPPPGAAPTPSSPPPDPMAAASALVTQRVIRVPVRPLVSGDARYNIVVRPGDVIRVPPSPAGNIYIDGEIARPGVYQLPFTGKLTLMQAITAGGGLGPLAIPERVDLTRRVGPDTQATIMLNLRAIAEGTQPDIYLKPHDRINIGTNFWATPLAVLRSGFRASYGFGFLLDRNFGNDVFGAPPSNVSN